MVCHESKRPRGGVPGVCNCCAASLVPKFVSFLRVRMPDLVLHYCCSPEVVNTLRTDSFSSIRVYRLFQEFYNSREHKALLEDDIRKAETKLQEMRRRVQAFQGSDESGSAERYIHSMLALQRRIIKVDLAKQALQNSLDAKPGELGNARDPKWASIYMGRFGEKWP